MKIRARPLPKNEKRPLSPLLKAGVKVNLSEILVSLKRG